MRQKLKGHSCQVVTSCCFLVEKTDICIRSLFQVHQKLKKNTSRECEHLGQNGFFLHRVENFLKNFIGFFFNYRFEKNSQKFFRKFPTRCKKTFCPSWSRDMIFYSFGGPKKSDLDPKSLSHTLKQSFLMMQKPFLGIYKSFFY